MSEDKVSRATPAPLSISNISKELNLDRYVLFEQVQEEKRRAVPLGRSVTAAVILYRR